MSREPLPTITAAERRVTKMAKPRTPQEKPTYSPSRLAHYARCPRAFALSRDWESQIKAGTENVMREGQLFEGYVFGFKGDKEEKELVGRKKADTISGIRKHAEYVRPVFETETKITERAVGPGAWFKLARKVVQQGRATCFVEEDWSQDDAYLLVKKVIVGQPYLKLEYETPGFIIRGEADYFGEIDVNALYDVTLDESVLELDYLRRGPLFVDLKYTGDISRVWDFNVAKEDYLQAIFYPYMHWKKTGKIVPFGYLVVENMYDVPVVRFIYMEITEEDFEFVERLIETVHNDFIFKPDAHPANCVGAYGSGRCWFMAYCEHGRRIVGGLRHFNFGELNTNFKFKPQ